MVSAGVKAGDVPDQGEKGREHVRYRGCSLVLRERRRMITGEDVFRLWVALVGAECKKPPARCCDEAKFRDSYAVR